MASQFGNREWSFVGGLIVAVALVAGQSLSFDGDHRKTMMTTVTAEEIDWHVRHLASDELKGRFTGSPEAERAAEYIAAEFRAYGLKPMGDDGTYMQRFPFVAGITLAAENSLMTVIDGQRRQWRVKEDFSPMTFSTEEPVEAEVVFVGYGISAPDQGYDDYTGIDVKGRIVLALRFSPDGDKPHGQFGRYASFRAKALMARQHGAKAIAFIADTDDFKTNVLSKLEFDYSFSDSDIVAVGISRQLANEFVSTTGATLEDLQKKIDETQKPNSQILPGVTARIQVGLQKETKAAANVIGYLPGNAPQLKDDMVIIGAHFDHLGLGGPNSLAPDQVGEVHNGADDNASGTAGLLELVGVFAGKRTELVRGLLFIAFSGEEEGALGSTHYVKNPVFPLDRVVAMINMDMIGRLRENTLYIQGVGTSPQWPPLIEDLNKSAAFNLKTTEDGSGPSDHRSFYAKDIPVLFFFTGTHSDYHKPSDDSDKINVEGEAKIVQYVHDVVTKIQSAPARPQFTKTQSSEQMGRRDFSVTLGVIPEYGDEVEGLKISGTRAGGPAEKAGLKAGDVIIRLGNTQVKNIYDYMFSLGELKAGEETEVEVMREGNRVVMKVVPGKR